MATISVQVTWPGGLPEWTTSGYPTESICEVHPQIFQHLTSNGNYHISDVRSKSEYELGSIEGSLHFPLDDIGQAAKKLERNVEYLVYCAGGYRSMIFISLLKAKGFSRLRNVTGGYSAIRAAYNG